jgi:hypothetical protein
MENVQALTEMSEAQTVFRATLQAGFLSEDRAKKNYVGLYMFMGIDKGKNKPQAAFKHINLRTYLYIPIELI